MEPRSASPAPSDRLSGPEVEEEGGRLTGVLGALLGALIGALPWFLASVLVDFYVGWLGFAIGWAAALGYRTLRGRRNFPFAMACVVVCSLLALAAANLGALVALLCMDVRWQDRAAQLGTPVLQLVLQALLMPENRQYVLPAMTGGLLTGAIGILTAGTWVRRYTDPVRAAETEQRVRDIRSGRAAYRSTGLALPRRFTVRAGRWMVLVPILTGVVFVPATVLLWWSALRGQAELLLFAGPFTLLTALALWQFSARARLRVDVDGDRLLAYSVPGRPRELHAADIAGVSVAYDGAVRLWGRDGKALGTFWRDMRNAPLLMQWLKEHEIPLRG